jgi:hypothetical protein
MAVITHSVRTVLLNRLADSTTGFNALLSTVSAELGVTPFAIDFSSGSENFFQAFVDPAVLEVSTSIAYPAIAVYTTALECTNAQKGQLFSGTVTMNVDIHLGHVKEDVSYDMETRMDAAEEAVIRCLNMHSSQQSWAGTGVFHSGRLTRTRYPLAPSSIGDWRQTSRLIFTFETNKQR